MVKHSLYVDEERRLFVQTDEAAWEGFHDRCRFPVFGRDGSQLIVRDADLQLPRHWDTKENHLRVFSPHGYFIERYPMGTSNVEKTPCRKAQNPRNRKCAGCEAMRGPNYAMAS